MSDVQMKLSNACIVFSCRADTVKVSRPYFCFLCKEKNYLSVKKPALILLQQGTKQEASFSNPYLLFLTSKLTQPVSSDFRTNRIIRDIDYQRRLAFDGSTSNGVAKTPLANQKKFTVVLRFATNDKRKRGSYLYNFPYFAGIEGQSSSEAGFGIGVDNNNAYIWSRMGDGGEIK